MSESERSTRRPLDAAALARQQRRLQRAPQPPWLHGEVARRMALRLPMIKLQPATVLDWGSFLGAGRAALQQAYPRAHLTAVEPDVERRDATRRAIERPWWSRWSAAAPVLTETEVEAASAQMLWSNMGLHGAPDPEAVMSRWLRALAVDGFLMFSTLGPGTLAGLRELYRAQGWPAPAAPFVDMHDLGDMLVHAGFADPVMDQERLTLTWPDAAALLAELRGLGGNAALDRAAGLRTPRWRARLLALLGARTDAAGRIALEFELVYGHAVKPPPRPRLAAETAVPLDQMRALVRRGRHGV
ncbi:MAG: methyltransferase domain-containing protein [Burkholderiales bacterium]|nr:methyltransferase domain-containing protein [Burkholderiales bacterium]MDE1927849.1 methyltransferase domain-containing protein [Burkholderiales bacterium]MDE2158903.1 methyltransferase domain-containing protein [Burkholderiales bacterium]